MPAEQVVRVDFAELEALNDVLEAARCYWHQNHSSVRAADTLKAAHRLFWTIGEYLPKTGEPSERFRAVMIDASSMCGKLLGFAQELARDYNKANDPWFADTIIAAENFSTMLPPAEWKSFLTSLSRLGLVLQVDSTLTQSRMVAVRKNLGPWRESAVKKEGHCKPIKENESVGVKVNYLASIVDPIDFLLHKVAGSSVKGVAIQPERLLFFYEVVLEQEAKFTESVRRLLTAADSFSQDSPLQLFVSKAAHLSETDELVFNEWRFEFQINANSRTETEIEPMLRSQVKAFLLELETYLFE